MPASIEHLECKLLVVFPGLKPIEDQLELL